MEEKVNFMKQKEGKLDQHLKDYSEYQNSKTSGTGYQKLLKFKLLQNKARAQSCISGQRSKTQSRAQTPNNGRRGSIHDSVDSSDQKKMRPVTSGVGSRNISR